MKLTERILCYTVSGNHSTQPRPQGAFPWLWGPPKPGKSALGTRLHSTLIIVYF